MLRKKPLNITIDNDIYQEMFVNNINISNTINDILRNRQHHINNLKKLIEISEKIELNINNKTIEKNLNLLCELKSLRPLFIKTLDYLNYETVKKRKRREY